MSLTASRATVADAGRTGVPGRVPVLTMGVEEEFLLVDRVSRAPVGRGPRVIAAAGRTLGPLVQPEFFTAQVEICTSPTTDAAALRSELSGIRAEVIRAAATEQCLLLAAGTPVVPPERPLTVTRDERYRRMASRFPWILGDYDQAVCGCHVHIGVDSRAEALDLANRMRSWLPVVQALAGNSPSTGAGTPATRAGGRWSTPAGRPSGPPRSSTKPRTNAAPRSSCAAARCWTGG